MFGQTSTGWAEGKGAGKMGKRIRGEKSLVACRIRQNKRSVINVLCVIEAKEEKKKRSDRS
jgi:hypothetical protein